jgi:4-diphosphocytidyl-2-C-methyl-D-erythritol kinase
MNISSFVSHPSSLRLRAPAKINWFLEITKKREDGYHDILSLMHCVNLYDNLRFEHAEIIEVESDLSIPPVDNLIYKAASLLKQHASYRKGARIILQKNIPMSAGLGGGSSDAAYTLLGLNRLWKLGLNQKELSAFGINIGSDVPFFINGTAALVEGKGEKVVPLELNSSFTMLLVKPPASVSTAWAYSAFDRKGGTELTKKPIDIKLICYALESRDFPSLGDLISNDLEQVVIGQYPVIGKIKEMLLDKGAAFSAMSGSGSAVFGVFESIETALSAAKDMEPYWHRIVETLPNHK